MEKLLPKIQNLRTESQIRSRSGRWGQETGYGNLFLTILIKIEIMKNGIAMFSFYPHKK